MVSKRSRVRIGTAAVGVALIATAVAVPAITTPDDDPCAGEIITGSTVGLDAVLVLDSSDNMASSDPDGLRQSLSLAFVNGMDERVRSAVVDFDDSGRVIQGLTDDRQALVEAIATIDDEGGSDLGAGVSTALAALSTDSVGDRDRLMVILTDGKGSGSYDASLNDTADAAGVRIYSIGIGSSVNAAWLALAAEVTGGDYVQAESFVGPRALQDHTGEDTDGDGLTDCEEAQGAFDASGKLHVTDAGLADTDGDGLTDGQEVTNDLDSFNASSVEPLLGTTLGLHGFRTTVADPNDRDTDGDGSEDALEFDVGTDPYEPDSDDDGLDDFTEVDTVGTDPLDRNTDGDNREDGWEVEHASAGFDPIVYDEEMSKWRYGTDFVVGAACPEGREFCETDSVAFLAGSLVGGAFVYKDVIDLISAVTDLDFVSAGIALASLAPVAGDAASVVSKSVRFIQRVPDRKKRDALAYIANNLPETAGIRIIELADGPSADLVKREGMPDEAILKLARSRIAVERIARDIRGALRVERSPTFRAESDAEDYLRDRTLGALPRQIAFPPPGGTSRSALGSRKPDVYSPMTRTAYEVKLGSISLTPHVREQITRDIALKADPNTPIDKLEWHFFTKEDGSIGMTDEVRDELTRAGIPFVIHLP